MTHLFAAFSVVWLGVFLYNFYLVRRLERLERDIRTLQDYVSAQDGERDA